MRLGRVRSLVTRNPLERRYGQGDLHFITFICVRRRPLLGTAEARNRFAQILDQVRNRYAFHLVGYVVMPEHVHLLMGEPANAGPSIAIQVLKQLVARALLGKQQSGVRSAESHFWQRRYYDFNVYSGKKITEKLNYMHLNPLKRNLVSHLKDWPWSSWSHYAGLGVVVIPIDRWDEPAGRAENPHP